MPRRLKPTLVIAGPGAGKTHNMVDEIIKVLPSLSSAKYLAVITFTNSASTNIRSRLASRIKIPENVFIGTIHSFMNRFIVIPFSSFSGENIAEEKKMIQCSISDIYQKANRGKNYSPQQAGIIKSRIRTSLIERGYIPYDQSLDLASKSMGNSEIAKIVSNRLQHLFIDEFQDTNNKIFEVVEKLRKLNTTKIYLVGDPEQFITSFDSSVKRFNNIPILKAARANTYEVVINKSNRRCSQTITTFLNQFNGRVYRDIEFAQHPYHQTGGERVKFIDEHTDVKPIIEKFNLLCDQHSIPENDRCIIAKKNDVIRRVETVLDGQYVSPNKIGSASPLGAIRDTLLTGTNLNLNDFCVKYNCDSMTFRKFCVELMIALSNGVINNENGFIEFIKDNYGVEFKSNIPFKINALKIKVKNPDSMKYTMIGNIHQVKGLEARAVQAIAKTEVELKLWLTTDQNIRTSQRNKETTDYPRIGYVAFSRAKDLLCVSCLERVSESTMAIIQGLGMEFIAGTKSGESRVQSLF